MGDCSVFGVRLAALVLSELVERPEAPALAWIVRGSASYGPSLSGQPDHGLSDERRREQVAAWARLLGARVVEERCHPDVAAQHGHWWTSVSVQAVVRGVDVEVFAHLDRTPFTSADELTTAKGGVA